VSPLFGCPALRSSAFLLDWLHVVDLGVGADILGNVMKMLLPKYAGVTQKQRCQEMLVKIQNFFRENKVTSRLDNLTPAMIVAPGKPPKLRGKAAEVRYLVPWVATAAQSRLADGT